MGETIARECEFKLDRIVLRGKRWGTEGAFPILALHGWLDNCASFDYLAPGFTHYDLVCLDLAGHGKSDHRQDGGAYNIWQDLDEVLAVSEFLGWDKFALLGHSRGAMICTLFAGTFPEKVSHLGLIESILPHAVKPEEAPIQLAAAINGLRNIREKSRNYYSSYERAVQARADGFVKLPVEDARVLAQRGVESDDNGFYWNYDARLMAPSEVKFTHDQVFAFVDNIAAPICLFVAENGMLNDMKDVCDWIEHDSDLQPHYLNGEHHLHMSQNFKSVKDVLLDFYD